MGEAYLSRRGGNAFRGLILISPPSRTAYFESEYVDMTGCVIEADFGTFTVPVDITGLYSPTRALVPSDTEITVTVTFGNRTKSISIPITVSTISTTFSDNPWSAIARIAELGEAGSYWSVGDSKTENGITYTIIGINHDSLSQLDTKYADTSYNSNSKKAALTLQVMTQNDVGHMDPRSNGNIGGWDQSYMRNNVLQDYYAGMPSDLRAIMRTVDKKTSIGGYNTTEMATSRDQLFLLAVSEVFPRNISNRWVLASEVDANPQYAYYANGGAVYRGAREWTRSPHAPSTCTEYDHFIGINDSGNPNIFVVYNDMRYYPAFCI